MKIVTWIMHTAIVKFVGGVDNKLSWPSCFDQNMRFVYIFHKNGLTGFSQ